MAGDVDGKFLSDQHSKLKSARATLDNHCQEVSELVIPMLAQFGMTASGVDATKGDKRTQKLMEGTAPLALDRYASAIEGFLVPRGERWSKLTTNNKALNRIARVKQYFDDVNDTLFGVRYDTRAGFQSQMHECLIGIGSVGTAGLFVDSAIRQASNGALSAGTAYRSIPLLNLWGSEGTTGQWDKVHREWRWSARNCVATFKEDTPEEIRKAYEKDPEQEFTLLHVVCPNQDYRIGKLGPAGMRYASYYVFPEKSQIISRGGYNTRRYAIARGPKGSGEHYGRSPAMTILPEIKTINEMRRSLLRAQHMTLSPPTLVHSEMGLNLKLRPRDINPGMVTEDGKPLAIPFQMGNNFPPTEREMERIRQLINDAFLITLFQILVERPQQTATETLERAKEKAIIVSPLISKLQSEFLGEIIESEIDILSEANALPPMPPELIEAAGEYSITYQSDIMRALQVGELAAYRGWVEDVAPIAQTKPHLLEVVDHEGILREAAEARGIKSKHIRTEEQLAKIAQQMQQNAALDQVLPVAAQAAQIEQIGAQTEALRRRAA
jgi:hypothetical protein